MNKLLQLIGTLTFSSIMSVAGYCQLLNPTISGDNMLCPEGTGSLTTETFETYQWYQRYFGSSNTTLIPGATTQNLLMDAYNYSASYLSVEVTENGTTEMSPEYFVDGWAFLPIAVQTTGDFTINNDGFTVVCTGDTLYFEVLSPNTTNIVWTESGNPIIGATDPILAVTTAGTYHVSGAPGECPNFIQVLGVDLDVLVQDCNTTDLNEGTIIQTQLYPNPATEELTITHPSDLIVNLQIHNKIGQLIQVIPVNGTSAKFTIDHLVAGSYFVTVVYSDKTEILPVIIR